MKKTCPFLDGCTFINYIKIEDTWDKIVTLFCRADYENCRRYLRKKSGASVPEDLWPLEDVAVSEILKELGFEFKKHLQMYRRYFLAFKGSSLFREILSKTIYSIESIERKHEKTFLKTFFKNYYDELFIKNFNQEFFTRMAHFYEKEKIDDVLFDSMFLMYTSDLAENLYTWLSTTLNNQFLQTHILSTFVKLNTLSLLFLKKNQKLMHELEILYRSHIKLSEVNKELYTDPLSGVYSRRFMEDFGEDIINRFTYLLFIDIDNFKEINDTCGHDAGDEVLRTLGSMFKKLLRDRDVIIRFGGDEFLIAVDTPTEELAMKVAKRIHSSIRKMEVNYEDKKIKVTVSVGVCKIDKEKSFEENLKRVDKALYRAKNSGRDRIVLSE
ncbi:GGDEF domain-containing protein [Desulfurobacterium sp.]|uniref:GGDEF domain-containing protein n=1 Tax=Desulfurobacterium sp. TaxID=2004706 RepID=UPI0026018EB7|nr:GGDEF domain-containing protein [Desulfurobacterium sp.]